MRRTIFTCTVLALALSSCQQQDQQPETAQGDWISGTPEEQIRLTEKHFRGFDMAMVEVGYRYQELYWAGQDQNWDYANYQADKMETAIRNGLERRPKRANSAQHFLNEALPAVKEAIEKRDAVVFSDNFRALTISCNACHAMEKVPFFEVQNPVTRVSPIGKHK